MIGTQELNLRLWECESSHSHKVILPKPNQFIIMKTITRKLNGMYEVYSTLQQRFVQADTLAPLYKIVADDEKLEMWQGINEEYFYRQADGEILTGAQMAQFEESRCVLASLYEEANQFVNIF